MPLSDASAGVSQVGGKGASLVRLTAAGLPVPPGFHITTAACRRFVAEHGLQEQILAAVSEATPDQPATLEEASRRIRQLFAQHAIPDDVAETIRRAYAGLGEGDLPVAVRSSATAEDLPGASFAGQQETYLNIRSAEAVLEAVKRCWASLWTARAIAYRARQGIAPGSVALAVVVQELVIADAAGVLFTANPLTGKRDEIVINAAWGLGEAIVSGAVTPDTLTVERATGRIVSRETAEKQTMTARAETGSREVPVPASQKKKAVLTDAQVAELAKLAAVAEAAKNREAVRSESIRLSRLVTRPFLLQVGNVMGIGDGVFFLTMDEMTALLAGDKTSLSAIPARREMHRRYCALPPYPALIYGRFDPFRWAADPKRRSDCYDARQTGAAAFSSTVKGVAGAVGCVEGIVRRIDRVEDGNQIQPGEILVTSITNVGWTPLFPRLAAIVTDVGAPLSHAAIVAREMGIPAVVGCGNATMLLKTGDHVRVDGGRGTVEILTG